jgi:hypothetical protein
MRHEMFGALFTIACIAVTVIVTARLRQRKLVFITDFQKGLRFRNGTGCTILPAGRYLVRESHDQITVVDMRPRQFIFERMPYRDALLVNFLMSVGGEILISDPQLAVTTLKELENDSRNIVREGLRLAASRAIIDADYEGRQKLAANITSSLNVAILSNGLEVRNLEITELWVPAIKHDNVAGSN